MKKLLEKDKKIRKTIYNFEKKKFILKSIFQNLNFFNLIRWKAYFNLTVLPSKSSKTFITNRCVKTIHKKKFNKLTNFSRMVFLKLVKENQINSIYKGSW